MILKGKVVIITGAGPGMGQAMCRGAAAEGQEGAKEEPGAGHESARPRCRGAVKPGGLGRVKPPFCSSESRI